MDQSSRITPTNSHSPTLAFGSWTSSTIYSVELDTNNPKRPKHASSRQVIFAMGTSLRRKQRLRHYLRGLINCCFKKPASSSKILFFGLVWCCDVCWREYITQNYKVNHWDCTDVTMKSQRILYHWTEYFMPWACNEYFYETIDCIRFLNISVNLSEITIRPVSWPFNYVANVG